jgi:two-component system chemotaxis response regulator CheB
MTSDIVVVGASAGGVEALRVIASGLPPDLPASLFVVLHIGSGIDGQSYLPEILDKAGPLHAISASEGQEIRKGMIYIAPPDFHLIMKPGHLHLSKGPMENRTRPAINPLFRSAALSYGSRVNGVILTGMQDDGIAGLAEVKRRGGVAIAQHPGTALFPSMPSTAIEKVEVDYVAPLTQIASIIAELAGEERSASEREDPIERILSTLTCPECRGQIWEERQGTIVEFRCQVGHAYSPLSMRKEHAE